MASFHGHLYGGAAVSAAAGLGVDSLGWARPDQVLALFVLGVAGGLLPDIDADNSTPVRILFTLLGVAAAFLVSLSLVDGISLVERILLWGAVFLLVRFGLFEAFARFTVHRGIWHSWLAGAFVTLGTVAAAYRLAGSSAWEAWLAGGFVALGYLTHLCLDEIASVDLRNNRVKRSFGTALKPFSLDSPAASVAMFLGALACFYLTPTAAPVIAAVKGLHLDWLSFSLPHPLG
ncbi:MAG: metal-dependent hydrolase [Candidatus Thiosymbion ectosymbiont of Robbea hypermnestra]|nr:metal-dependent hydrolase [Candidatus Thiosymbion ectosymbiont of Robbea hypermnestra]